MMERSPKQRRGLFAWRAQLGPLTAAAGIVAAGFAAATSLAGASSISGVCPDGSIFIVRSAEQIPCADAKRVEPDQIPPLRPHYLPRPYAWERFQERQDPNNPYNVMDSGNGAKPPEAATAPPAPSAPPALERAGNAAGASAPPMASAGVAPTVPATPVTARVADLALSNDEIRALVAIIELSQERAPATIEEPAEGDPALLIRLAHSPAFEARVREAWAAAGRPLEGPVVVFTAEARHAVAFQANLTFAQGHVAFHPDHGDPRQFGILRGHQGALGEGEIALGYVVLPEATDPATPIDVYWNDRRITATLAAPATS
jgi:hypothetical protein